MSGYYPHYSLVENWRWPNFTPYELRCRGTEACLIVPEALDRLQAARHIVGKPFTISSAFRSAEHNTAIGGAMNSWHKFGLAFDISLEGMERSELRQALIDAGFRGIGHYKTFIHADCRLTGPVEFDG